MDFSEDIIEDESNKFIIYMNGEMINEFIRFKNHGSCNCSWWDVAFVCDVDCDGDCADDCDCENDEEVLVIFDCDCCALNTVNPILFKWA